jgi:hypothetical protein
LPSAATRQDHANPWSGAAQPVAGPIPGACHALVRPTLANTLAGGGGRIVRLRPEPSVRLERRWIRGRETAERSGSGGMRVTMREIGRDHMVSSKGKSPIGHGYAPRHRSESWPNRTKYGGGGLAGRPRLRCNDQRGVSTAVDGAGSDQHRGRYRVGQAVRDYLRDRHGAVDLTRPG